MAADSVWRASAAIGESVDHETTKAAVLAASLLACAGGFSARAQMPEAGNTRWMINLAG
jgi:hypothetical protein